MKNVRAIEVSFARPVELTQEDQRDLDALLGRISRRYVAAHPDRVMWPFGAGAKMLVNPLCLSDDEPIPFDESVYSVEVAERENYAWPCAKCGEKLDAHTITPGACDYAPKQIVTAEAK